jgi:hypothetical protein
MKAIKNMHDLKLQKEKLRYKELLYERDLSGSSASIINNLNHKLRDVAFDLGSYLVTQVLSGMRKSHK